jgi:hypothetical protein
MAPWCAGAHSAPLKGFEGALRRSFLSPLTEGSASHPTPHGQRSEAFNLALKDLLSVLDKTEKLARTKRKLGDC